MSKQILLFPKTSLVKARMKRLRNEEKLTDAQRKGKSGEQLQNLLLNSALKYRYEIKHNDFDNYARSQEKGVDLRVYNGKRLVFAIEVKNWKWQKRTYGIDYIKEQILSRFDGIICDFKVLIISHKKMLSEEGLHLLEENHVRIYEVGHSFFIGYHNPRKNPEFFYEQVDELKQFFYQLDQTLATLQQTLDAIEQTQIKASEPPFFSYSSNQSNSNLETELYNQTSIALDSVTNSLCTLTSDILTIDNNFADNLIDNQRLNYKIRITHDTPNSELIKKEQNTINLPFQEVNYRFNAG
jgi:hypothetical protein